MDLYKIIIADDEPMIRKGLVNNIDWEEMGYEVVADFMDGQDVIEYLQEKDVNVVFTDVQMCQVSGLEVTHWIREYKPDIKVVIVSGYKEFEYVKKAMDMKVCEYVLKPVNYTELKSTFLKIKTELDERVHMQKQKISTLFSYQEDESCVKVLQEESGVIEAIMKGKPDKLGRAYRLWKQAMHGVLPEYMPLLVLHILDELFSCFEKDGVCLGDGHEKTKILRQIRCFQGDELLQKAGEIFQEITIRVEKKKSTATEDVITKAKEYIDTHLDQAFGVEELATYVYLNRSYFSREFKANTGVSVMDYIIQRRMEKACELLKMRKYSTKKVAKMVGYGDVKYFLRSFKKYTGHTVREYCNLYR